MKGNWQYKENHTENDNDNRYPFIPSRDDDQRILKSDWTRGTSGHSQPMVVVDAFFPWWLSSCKKLNVLIGSFQGHYWSKNPAILLDKRHKWTQPNKRSLKCYFPLMTYSKQKKKTRHQLILLGETYDQTKVAVSDAIFAWWLTPCIKT